MSSRHKAGLLADCLLAWKRGDELDDTIDYEPRAHAKAGAFRVAELMNTISAALTKQSGGRHGR